MWGSYGITVSQALSTRFIEKTQCGYKKPAESTQQPNSRSNAGKNSVHYYNKTLPRGFV